MAVRVTLRDIKVLRWINRLGFMNINQITTLYKASKPTVYARMRKLVDEGLLRHEYYLDGEPGVYRVTRQGVSFTCDDMRPLKELRLSSFKHDTMVTNVILSLIDTYQCDVKIRCRV